MMIQAAKDDALLIADCGMKKRRDDGIYCVGRSRLLF